jgi:hypothetical protein
MRRVSSRHELAFLVSASERIVRTALIATCEVAMWTPWTTRAGNTDNKTITLSGKAIWISTRKHSVQCCTSDGASKVGYGRWRVTILWVDMDIVAILGLNGYWRYVARLGNSICWWVSSRKSTLESLLLSKKADFLFYTRFKYLLSGNSLSLFALQV